MRQMLELSNKDFRASEKKCFNRPLTEISQTSENRKLSAKTHAEPTESLEVENRIIKFQHSVDEFNLRT